ncbi:F-box/LRR-repeat protein 20 isoform X2 [Linepithema humile]|uniref:F-box/LRR-repeat protein 20 isoform X2 n=1 Tax=Linepithema humile TaxID=83485 RepID=UPI00062385F0|nr:PREDICTED: F-box/LRR-repeat protein 20 isoform X2 [Linepithema humile]
MRAFIFTSFRSATNVPLSRRCTQSARRRRSRPTLAKITIQWEACKQWLWTRWLVALSSSRPRASNLAAAPTESGGAPFHAPTPQSHVEHSVDSAISLAKRSDSLGRATFFFVTAPCGYSRKFCKITRRKRMIHSGRTRLELTWVFHDDEAQINKKLPKELLLRIFSYLDVVSLCRCAQVSKAWNVLALDGSNWQRIDLFDFQRDVEGPVIENISRRCGGFLRQLSLKGCQSIGNNSMRTLAQSCPNIEELNLSQCKRISDATCAALSSHCSKLQRLNLDSCPEITDMSLKDLAAGCLLLTHINLSWCELLTDNGVDALAKGCPELRSFLSKGCRQLTDKAVMCLARYCPNLEAINLHECRNITDDGVRELSERCPRLHYVCLSNCPNLTDATLISLAQHCPLLSVLECVACTHFTDTGFQALARNCKLLEKMDLEECLLITDATLTHLAMGCPRLEKLSLSHCELITDEGLRQIALSPCAAEHLAVLELDNCPNISDNGLNHVMQACHNLERIELYDCLRITREGIRKLRAHLPNLKVHAYFAPPTPPPSAGASRQRYCRCCVIL